MRTGISFTVSSVDRVRLTALISNRNAPQKHVWRAKIVLLSADGVGTVEIMRRTGKSKTYVWRWQERLPRKAVTGCCATRRGRRAFHRSVPMSVRRPTGPPT
jgi:hypothetical protein